MLRICNKWGLAIATFGLIVVGTVAADARPKLTGEEQLAKMLEGRVPGKPVNCIFMPQVTSSVVIDKTAIVYNAGRTIYVERPKNGASSLSDDDVLVTRMTSPELCTVDTVQLHDRTTGFWRGFVSLDQFVPYTRVPKVAASK